MNAPENSWPAWISAGAAGAVVVYATLRRFFSFVTREEFELTLNQRHQENKEDGAERKAALRRIEDKFDAAQFGVMASRLERTELDIQDLRDWKHSVDPFIVRRIDP